MKKRLVLFLVVCMLSGVALAEGGSLIRDGLECPAHPALCSMV